ncbi:MAG: hypothetical protein A2W52_04275 [Candidatus Taylorbacteria bacterium RIFCSPHIGHO2_02_49_25]|uniref:Leucine-binding protein domain-containing protein n=1 Tax=Candidatus Taylorbacteria bacterium RIFCSPHIGHO2_02_49_25 TaxID=1802305 RepID=A0A1G2MFF8_9BACT|nr:MAG: hypothetical protein A2759_01170 [Candidatus Taylorbacteria bacterium RIFCSPHIGHO2_01_FULL_49_60]OHA22640.1 MAG: hypothetical protein A2W52_04275 [Candidatus Taylorbacteria bacterium RIFCSPHIGHO2_02_49_25]OHA36526.1 MAG: hypothetical protein A2W65_04440 [Candidatus Taylorbacteria bacterium RIFCSPLOWO2_02_50_13]OHA48197.1 MAG: hypothetical protein A3G61_04715 [Candidatus Taylorbacteria bacterium RIFCSPLOWO2_12_FULL_49_67]HCB35118.1 hypothetical protein [Candidatus Taylorbacteria bacteriu
MEPETQETESSGSSFAKTAVWIVLLILVVGGLIFYESKKGEEEAVTKEPIKIGVLVPLTGDGAPYGEPARNVYLLAAEEINAAGGVSGQPLELIIEDSKCNGKDATSAAQKLINIDKVQIILGGFCSSESIAATPVAEAAKVAILSPGSSSPDLTGISPYFFRNYPSDASQGKVLAEAAATRGWKKIAFLQEQTDYALGVYKAFSSRFTELGGTIIKEEVPSNTIDFRSVLTKLKAANADAFFLDPQTLPVAERVFKQMQDLKWKPVLLFNDVIGGAPETLVAYKDAMEGALTAEFTADSSNPKFIKLLADYKVKYGTDLLYASSYGPTEYDAVYLIKVGIEAVGNNGEKFAAWSRTVKDWEGASGKTTIGADGDRVGGHTLKVVKDGKTEVVQQ